MGKSPLFKPLPGADSIRGREIKKVILDSEKIYLATNVGLSISEDDGKTFKAYTQTDGLPDNVVEDIVMVNGDLYVRSLNSAPRAIMKKGERIFAPWVPGGKDAFSGDEKKLKAEIDKYEKIIKKNEHVQVVSVAHAGDRIYVGSYQGIYLSKDSGKSFHRFAGGIGLPSDTVNSVAVKNGKIYAGTDAGFVILSEDEGDRLPTGSNAKYASEIERFFIDQGRIFLSSADGFRYTADGGKTYKRIADGKGLASKRVRQFFIRGDNWYFMAGGFFVSHDGGRTFEHFSSEEYKFYKGDTDALFIDEQDHWYIGDDHGFSISKDQGASFHWVETGSKVHALLKTGSDLWIGTDAGLMHSVNDGKTFFLLKPTSGIAGGGVRRLREVSGKLFVGSRSGFSVSLDRGRTFRLMTGIAGDLKLEDFYVEDDVIYVQRDDSYTGALAFRIHGTYLEALWRSNIRHFYLKDGNFYADLRAYVAVIPTLGKPMQMHTSTGLGGLDIHGIAVTGDRLYVGTGQGLFISSDKGKTFFEANFTTNRVNHNVNSVYADEHRVVIGTWDDLQVSEDQGASFRTYPVPYVPLEHFPTHGDPDMGNHVETAYLNGQNILVGTIRGFAVSKDDGKSFKFLKIKDATPSVADIQGFGQEAILATNLGIFIYDIKSGALREVNTKSLEAKFYSAVAMNGTKLFIGTDQGIFTCDQAGAILSKTPMSRVAHISLAGGKLFVSGQGGLSVSNDDGKTFKTYGTESGVWYSHSTTHLVGGGKIYVGGRGLFVAEGLQ